MPGCRPPSSPWCSTPVHSGSARAGHTRRQDLEDLDEVRVDLVGDGAANGRRATQAGEVSAALRRQLHRLRQLGLDT